MRVPQWCKHRPAAVSPTMLCVWVLGVQALGFNKKYICTFLVIIYYTNITVDKNVLNVSSNSVLLPLARYVYLLSIFNQCYSLNAGLNLGNKVPKVKQIEICCGQYSSICITSI